VANSFVKAGQVVSGALGVLERDSVLLNFAWRDFGGTFRGALNDTITLRLPAYMTARTRVMRSTTAITLDELDETSVNVTLDTHVYKALRITDEEMTLDIMDFNSQVMAPAMSSVVRKVDDAIATEMASATPEVTVTLTESDPYLGIVDARIALNNANVPADGRFLILGANVEAALLKSNRLSQFDMSGSSQALREAVIGRIAGFTALSVPGLDPDTAIASHRTAFPVALVAPVVPGGASWGENRTWRGLSLRVVRDYLPTDSQGPADRFLTDTFLGTGVTLDRGTIGVDGRFVPSEDGTDDPILVRAVKLELGS
jgi:hypothetical protein